MTRMITRYAISKSLCSLSDLTAVEWDTKSLALKTVLSLSICYEIPGLQKSRIAMISSVRCLDSVGLASLIRDIVCSPGQPDAKDEWC